MIDTRELRIGNWIMFNDYNPIQEVFMMVSDLSYEFGINNPIRIPDSYRQPHYYSIPLDEEWLLKYGFEKSYRTEDVRSVQYVLKEMTILLHVNPIFGSFHYFGNPIVLLGYVHQLQNLYFALTGEELTIKETVK